MGYWSTNEQGRSFTEADNGEELVWGDQPADVLDEAIQKIKALFLHDVGRLPSVAEMRAGVEFSFGVIHDDLPQVPSQAKSMTHNQGEVMSQQITDALRWDEPTSTEKQRNAWRHIRAVFESLKPDAVEVPDSPADLGPF